jgi:hypothetical protein
VIAIEYSKISADLSILEFFGVVGGQDINMHGAGSCVKKVE